MQWNCLSDYLACNGFARLTGRDTTDLPNRISGFFKDRVLISSIGTGTYRLIVFQKYKNFTVSASVGMELLLILPGPEKSWLRIFAGSESSMRKFAKNYLGLLVLYLFSLLKNKLQQEHKPIKL